MAKSTKGIIAVLIAVVIWASTYSISKIGLETIPLVTLVLSRSVIACIFLYMLLLKIKENNKALVLLRKNFKEILLLGLTGIFLQNVLANLGLVAGTTSSLAAVLVNTNPLFILVLAVLFLGENLSINKILGMIVGFIGMVFIILPSGDIGGIFASKAFLGNLLVLGAAISWAIYSIVGKNFSKNIAL